MISISSSSSSSLSAFSLFSSSSLSSSDSSSTIFLNFDLVILGFFDFLRPLVKTPPSDNIPYLSGLNSGNLELEMPISILPVALNPSVTNKLVSDALGPSHKIARE